MPILYMLEKGGISVLQTYIFQITFISYYTDSEITRICYYSF